MLLFQLSTYAEAYWPTYLSTISYNNNSCDCVFYPAPDIKLDSARYKQCLCDNALLVYGRNWVGNKKISYRIDNMGFLFLESFKQSSNGQGYVDITNCVYNTSKGVPLTFTGVVLLPLERQRKCDYKVIRFKNGKIESESTLPWLDFETFILDDAKYKDTGEKCMLKTLLYNDWATWGTCLKNKENDEFFNRNIKQFIIKDTLVITSEASNNDCSVLSFIDTAKFANERIRHIKIDGVLNKVGDKAVVGLRNLRSIDFGKTLYFGNDVVSHCPNLEYVNFGDSVRFLNKRPITFCPNIERIAIQSERYKTFDEVLYDKQDSVLIYFPSKSKMKRFVVPEWVKSIDDYAFAGNSSLESVSMSDAVYCVRTSAFENCTKLRQIRLSDNIDCLENHLFRGCSRLTAVNLPRNLRFIENGQPFENTDVRFTNVPSDLFRIDNGMLASNQGHLFYCPRSSCKRNMEIPEGYRFLYNKSLCDCKTTEKLILPSTIVLMESAIVNCNKLKDIHMKFDANKKYIKYSSFGSK